MENALMKLDWWPNPVTTEGRTTIDFNIGDTLDQVLGRVVSFDNCEIAVFVNGASVPRESWRGFVIEPNDIISARVIMTDGDGGSNPIAVVLSIAILVAAPFAAAAILGTTAAAVGATIGGAALTAGIGFVGLLVINSLFPPRLPDNQRGGASKLPRQYSISGGANRARPYEPLLLLLGSHKLFPDLAAKEYTEYEDDDQFLFQLFDFGIGNLDIGTLKIGDTDLSDYTSVSTNYNANQSLVYGDVDTVAGGEFDASNLAAISRTLGAMTTQIGFDIVSQYYKVSGGGIDGITINLRLEYKLETASTWTSNNISINTPNGSKGRVPKRSTYTYNVTSGTYDVRASITSTVSTEDTYTFQAAVNFKGYQDTTANWKGRNPLAVKIKATGQLYGRVGTLNAESDQLIDHWNGSSWIANSKTSNPGDILYKYLRGWNDSDGRLIAGMGLPSNRIDEESIKLFVTFCGDNGLECNVVIEDGRDHAETLRLICQCGWGAVDLQSGKWGVLYEDFGRALSAIVNPDNVIAGSMTVVYENEALADEIIGDFIDSASDYEQNQIRRTVPNKTNPKRPTVIPLEGIVKGEHAAKELNRAVAAQAYHIRSITWEMDLAEGMPIARGDVVGISHGLVGSGKGGRFTNIDSTRLKVTPSRTYSDSDTGSIWIWDLNDNVFSGTFTVNASGEIVLSAALPNPPASLYDNPTAYRFMTFLTSSAIEKVRVISKEPASSTKLRFIARDEVDDYYNYRTSDLTWTTVTRRLIGNPSSPVTAFSVSQDQNGVRIFAWALHHSRLIVRYQIRYGGSSDDFDDMLPLHDGYLISSPFESFNFPSAGSYKLGLVGLSEDGLRTTPVYRDYTFGNVSLVGSDGATWHTGTNAPGSALGNNGDFYFRTSNTTVYSKSSGAWSVLASLAGADGATWHTGTTVPASSLGNNGDFYFKSDDASIWSKASGAWTQQIEIEEGTDGDDGEDGATWISGFSAPSNNQGKVGDFYFRFSNGYVYEKVASNAWSFLRDITGPQGLRGLVGDSVTIQSAIANADGDIVITFSDGATATIPKGTVGRGITSITRDADTNTVTITFDDGSDNQEFTLADGVDGKTWFSGSDAPAVSLGLNGDFYLRTSNKNVYKKVNGVWGVEADLSGTDGATWFNGTDAPLIALGINGDFYFRTSNATIWSKALGSWTQLIDITGSVGRDGSTWLSGNGAPANALGEIEDWYFRTSNGYVYEKTAATVWTFRRDVTGPQGASITVSSSSTNADGNIVVNFSDGSSITVPSGTDGDDGEDGDDGDPASRGSGWFREGVLEAEQSQIGTFTASLNATWTARANALTPGENIANDIVTFWRGESFSSSWYWNGTTWVRMLKFIGAETVLAVDISAITGSFADLNVTGVLSADHIDSDVINSRVIFDGESGDISQWVLSVPFVINENDWSHLLCMSSSSGMSGIRVSDIFDSDTESFRITNDSGSTARFYVEIDAALAVESTDISSVVANADYAYLDSNGDYVVIDLVSGTTYDIYLVDGDNLTNTTAPYGLKGRTPALAARHSEGNGQAYRTFMDGRDLVTIARDEVAYKIDVDNPTESVESTDISSVVANADYAYLDSNGDYVVIDLVSGTTYDIYLVDGDNLTNTTAPYGLKGRTPALAARHSEGNGQAYRTFMDGRDLVTIARDVVAYKIDVDNPTESVESTDISSVVAGADYAYLDSNGDYVVIDLVSGTTYDIYLVDGDNLTNTTAPYGLKGRTPALAARHSEGNGQAYRTFMDGRDLVTIARDEVAYKIDVPQPSDEISRLSFIRTGSTAFEIIGLILLKAEA